MNVLRFVSFLILTLFASQAAAKTSYVVGVEALPYLPHYTSEGGEYRGFARDVLDEFAKAQGIQFEYRPLPVERLFRALVDGDVDFKYPDSPFWNRAIKKGVDVSYSGAVAPYVDGVMVPPKAVGKTKADVEVLGTVRGFTPWAFIDEIEAERIKVRENSSFAGLLRQTMAGRVDGAYVNADVARYALRHVLSRPEALRFDENLPHIRDNYQLSTAVHAKLIDAFNLWLSSNTAFLAAQRAKWGIAEKVE